jgi:general stress protein 26
METPDARKVALEFLKSKKAGVLSTLSPANEPRARLVYYSSDDAFNVYFLTMANTRKAEDIAAHPKAAFTIADEDAPRTLQIEGDVADITDSPADDAVIETLFHNLKMNAEYYAPLARLDRGDVRFYRLSPTWVRFGNFVAGHSTAETQFEIAP